jgi:hypothetical protein
MENTMNKMNKIVLGGVIVLAALSGCQTKMHGEQFTDESKPTATGQITQAQSAAGAKSDAMLYDTHFDGSKLNSLGQVKLDLICKATAVGSPVVVYLNMPQDRVALCEPAVTAYLKSAGLGTSQITLIAGANPHTTPAAYNLGTIYKTDGNTYNGQAAAEVASPGK